MPHNHPQERRQVVRISHQHRLIAFSNRKCGSTSIRAALDGVDGFFLEDKVLRRHCSAVRAEKAFAERGWDFSAYTKFTTIRNPWSRVVSLYTFGKYGNGNIWAAHYAKFPEFEDFVRNLPLFFVENSVFMYPLPAPITAGGMQIERALSIDAFGQSERHGYVFDHVMPMEEMEERLPAFLQTFGIEIEIEHRHKSKDFAKRFKKEFEEPDDYRRLYSDHSAELVAELFGPDIRMGGYTFD